jgi:hypothetical protein
MEEIENIRDSIKRSRPYGSEKWVSKAVTQFGFETTIVDPWQPGRGTRTPWVVHERQHINDFMTGMVPEVPPDYCRGKKNGTPGGYLRVPWPRVRNVGRTRRNWIV